jgi:hypothetical protein
MRPTCKVTLSLRSTSCRILSTGAEVNNTFLSGKQFTVTVNSNKVIIILSLHPIGCHRYTSYTILGVHYRHIIEQQQRNESENEKRK